MNSTKVLQGVAIGVVAFDLCCLYVFPNAWIGRSRESSNGVATASSVSVLVTIIWSVLGLSLFTVLMTRRQSLSVVGVPAWWRRVTAFLIDFHFALITLVGTSEIAGLALRVTMTGHATPDYQSPHSMTPAFVVVIVTLLALVSLAALLLYFVFPLTKGRQTVGCFVMGIKVTPPFGIEGRFTWSAAIRRTWLEIHGTCSGTWFNPRRDADGNTWYDLESGCRVVSVDYNSVA